MTKTEVFKSLATLSCGTIATITGIKEYDKQDKYMKNLIDLIECLPNLYFKDCTCWQESFNLLKEIDFINIEMHDDVLANTEKITQKKTIIRIKRYDSFIADIEIDENENFGSDKGGKFFVEIITLDSKEIL